MLHPATRLLLWSAWVVVVQIARWPFVGVIGLFVLVAGFWAARTRCARLLRRVRILLGVLAILFAFFTPGEALLPGLGAAGPTREGLAAAGLHGLRLVSVVVLVALLLEKTGQAALVGGLTSLARPLHVLGLSADRLAVRMLLVLQYASAPPVRGWRAFLVEDERPAEPGVIVLPKVRPGWPDVFVWSVLAIGVAAWMFA